MSADKTEIVIEIDPSGAVSADVVNGPGGSLCLVALHKLLSELGEQTTARRKPAFYQAAVAVATVKKGATR